MLLHRCLLLNTLFLFTWYTWINMLHLYLSKQSQDHLEDGRGHKFGKADSPIRRQSKINQPIRTEKADMIYTIEDVPPWYLCILLGLQNPALAKCP
ncbi:hypothetical protein GOODEAATRI_028826 [Goodea atripinnis]|uniref:Secreted protein n=1 Tax=Goodea atripinnis TaxID=208336 RepID=A0ABV0MLL4_9TELE